MQVARVEEGAVEPARVAAHELGGLHRPVRQPAHDRRHAGVEAELGPQPAHRRGQEDRVGKARGRRAPAAQPRVPRRELAGRGDQQPPVARRHGHQLGVALHPLRRGAVLVQQHDERGDRARRHPHPSPVREVDPRAGLKEHALLQGLHARRSWRGGAGRGRGGAGRGRGGAGRGRGGAGRGRGGARCRDGGAGRGGIPGPGRAEADEQQQAGEQRCGWALPDDTPCAASGARVGHRCPSTETIAGHTMAGLDDIVPELRPRRPGRRGPGRSVGWS